MWEQPDESPYGEDEWEPEEDDYEDESEDDSEEALNAYERQLDHGASQ